MYIWIHDKYSSTASNSDYGREKLFSYDKINVSNHVCHCVVQWSRSCVHVQINWVRLPATIFSVSLYRFFFFLFFFFWPFFFLPCFKHYFSFWHFFLYSYCLPWWSCTWINIYLKLKSGILFWQRDFKSSWYAYWPSLRPDKNHKLSSKRL